MKYYLRLNCPSCKKCLEPNLLKERCYYKGFGSPFISCPYCGKPIFNQSFLEIALIKDIQNIEPRYLYEYKQSLMRISNPSYLKLLQEHAYIATLQSVGYKVNPKWYSTGEQNALMREAKKATIQYIPDANYIEERRIVDFISEYANVVLDNYRSNEIQFDDISSAIKEFRISVMELTLSKYTIKNAHDLAVEYLGEYQSFANDSTTSAIAAKGPKLSSIYNTIRYTLWFERQKSILSKSLPEGVICKYFNDQLLSLDEKCCTEIESLINKKKLDLIKHDSSFISNGMLNNQIGISSPADEIRKYKALYDDGIITEEEYYRKKQQLLNI